MHMEKPRIHRCLKDLRHNYPSSDGDQTPAWGDGDTETKGANSPSLPTTHSWTLSKLLSSAATPGAGGDAELADIKFLSPG